MLLSILLDTICCLPSLSLSLSVQEDISAMELSAVWILILMVYLIQL